MTLEDPTVHLLGIFSLEIVLLYPSPALVCVR